MHNNNPDSHRQAAGQRVMKKPAARDVGFYRQAMEALQDDAEKRQATDIVLSECADLAVYKEDNLPNWCTQSEPMCGKCHTKLPGIPGAVATADASPVALQLPSGWQAVGRNKTSLRCANCNALCVRLHRTGFNMSAFSEFSPIEVAQFMLKAHELSGNKLKEDRASCLHSHMRQPTTRVLVLFEQ